MDGKEEKMRVQFIEPFFCKNQTLSILNELFGEVEVGEEPDFVFFSNPYSTEIMSYTCPRIFVTGENIVPDFNVVDYAVGFQYMNFEDRYVRVPLYCFFEDEYQKALKKHLNPIDPRKKEFCNFVYSNGRDAMKERDNFFYELSKYKKVDSGGRHLNNIGQPVDSKLDFQSKYKFTIAFENAKASGYTTEKIIHAFASGTIPIYYGNPEIGKEFNKNAFINCHEYDSFEKVIERVREIDENDEQYLEMMSTPIFTNVEEKTKPLQEYSDFLNHICSQKIDESKRRCDDCWGARLQRERRDYNLFIKARDGQNLKGRMIRYFLKRANK